MAVWPWRFKSSSGHHSQRKQNNTSLMKIIPLRDFFVSGVCIYLLRCFISPSTTIPAANITISPLSKPPEQGHPAASPSGPVLNAVADNVAPLITRRLAGDIIQTPRRTIPHRFQLNFQIIRQLIKEIETGGFFYLVNTDDKLC